MVKAAYMLLFLFVLNLASQPEDMFRVPSFMLSPQEDISRDSFIRGNNSDPLLNIASVPENLKPGEVIKRIKKEDGYYLYLGNIDTSAFHSSPKFFYYEIPSWSNLKNILTYRFYNSPTHNYNLDEEVVYFDNNRIYASHHEELSFISENAWHTVSGVNKNPSGDLHIISEPPGAEVFLFGENIGALTPCTLKNLTPGDYEIELFLEEHRFSRRRVSVVADSMTKLSFELLSDFEEVHIIGESRYGRLILPYPPIGNPFQINNSPIEGNEARLPEGKYDLRWNGGNRYRSIDTTIYIRGGELQYFNLPFQRLFGVLRINTIPRDVMVCIEDQGCETGKSTFKLPSGLHSLKARKRAYEPEDRKIMISPDVITPIQIVLEPDMDRDRDGYPDSVDRCPDDWGIFSGCPKMHFLDAFYIKMDEVRQFVKSDPISFGFSAIGTIFKSSSRKPFSDILSDFSGGRIAAANNYKSFTAMNLFHISWRGMLAQLELGQWSSGLRYTREDTLTLETENETYIAYYDTLNNIEPVIYLPSTALSFGLRYQLEKFSISYSVGYQWEDIIFEGMIALSDNSFHKVTFDNDWWFHQLQLRYNLGSIPIITPSVYFRIKFPFGPVMKTRWSSINMGIQVDISNPFRREKDDEQ